MNNESRERKLKNDYFTSVIQHDQSIHNVELRTLRRQRKSQPTQHQSVSPVRLNDTFRSQIEMGSQTQVHVKVSKKPLNANLVKSQFLTSLNLDNTLTHQQLEREVRNESKTLPHNKSDTRLTID